MFLENNSGFPVGYQFLWIFFTNCLLVKLCNLVLNPVYCTTAPIALLIILIKVFNILMTQDKGVVGFIFFCLPTLLSLCTFYIFLFGNDKKQSFSLSFIRRLSAGWLSRSYFCSWLRQPHGASHHNPAPRQCPQPVELIRRSNDPIMVFSHHNGQLLW